MISKNNQSKRAGIFFLSFFLLLPANFILAQDTEKTPFSEFKNAANAGGYSTTGVDEYSVAKTAGALTFGALGLLGVIFISLVIYAGWLWMTAHGKAEHIEKSRTILFNAIVGLLIVFGAMVFTRFILETLLASGK
jgi:hypothetical protein